MSDNPTIRSMVIERMQGSVALTFSASDLDCKSYLPMSQTRWESHRNIPLQITITMATYYGESMTTEIDRDQIISDICCSVPCTNVQTVHAINASFSRAFWRKTLGHLQDLRYITSAIRTYGLRTSPRERARPSFRTL